MLTSGFVQVAQPNAIDSVGRESPLGEFTVSQAEIVQVIALRGLLQKGTTASTATRYYLPTGQWLADG